MFDLPGHGAAGLDREFSTPAFAEAVAERLAQDGRGPFHCFGYSMGGYVALLAARRHRESIASIITLGTKFDWSPEVAAREALFLDPATIGAKAPAFAALLAKRHTALGWESVLGHTALMMGAMGVAPPLNHAMLRDVTCPVRVMVGDRDGTVTLDESAAVARALPHGELQVLPRTAHPIEKAPLDRVAAAVLDFVGGNP